MTDHSRIGPAAGAAWAAFGALLLAACTGNIDPIAAGDGPGTGNGDGSGGADPGMGAPPGAGDSTGMGMPGTGSTTGMKPGGNGPPIGEPPPVAEACTKVDVGVTPLRRLSRIEYDNTIRDLLKDTSRPAQAFAPDEELLGFSAGLEVSPVLVEQYRTAAENLAKTAVSDVPGLLGCTPEATGSDPCANGFIDRFGQRAYRRPLDADEKTGLTSLYESSRDLYGANVAVELVLQAILQSPQFLYRVEFGESVGSGTEGVVQLGAYEIATRLSYFLWQSTPDETLLDAAAAGELDTPEGIEARAREMVLDDRSRDTVKSFHAQWLELDELQGIGKDESVYPEFDDALRVSMEEETLRFVENVVFDGDGTVQTFFTGAFSFVDGPLAAIYGLEPPGDGQFVRVDLDPAKRAGILTQPSILSIFSKSNQSSPVHRGKFVRERLLCHPLRPPPAGFVIVPPEVDPTLPTRERFSEHADNPTCAQCHDLTDPIGFGFEHFDAIGRYRDKDGDFDVDAKGEVLQTRDADGTFDGAIELGQRLASSEQVRECVAANWFVYAFGRSMTNDYDVCSRARIYDDFKKSSYNVRELLVSLVKSDAFRFRRATIEGGGN
jgi:hypothetical protein